MATFKYLGDADENTLATKVFGIAFLKGQMTEVTDPYAVAKLRNNPRFEHIQVEDAVVLSEDAPRRRGRPPVSRIDVSETDGD